MMPNATNRTCAHGSAELSTLCILQTFYRLHIVGFIGESLLMSCSNLDVVTLWLHTHTKECRFPCTDFGQIESIRGLAGFYVFGFLHYNGLWYYSGPGRHLSLMQLFSIYVSHTAKVDLQGLLVMTVDIECNILQLCQ